MKQYFVHLVAVNGLNSFIRQPMVGHSDSLCLLVMAHSAVMDAFPLCFLINMHIYIYPGAKY